MNHTIICPICGSENPEGSEFCQVCKANLKTLPSEIFRNEQNPAEPEKPVETTPQEVQNDDPDLDSPVPEWLKDKLKPAEKKPMDFDSYTDWLFGTSDSSRSSSPNKTFRTKKQKKQEQVYQPMFQSMIEPPLIEPDENTPKTLEENIPGIADFTIQRPARKWEDKQPEAVAAEYKGTSVSLLDDFKTERPARKWDDRHPVDEENTTNEDDGISQLPLWWQQDSPLVEEDENAQELKSAEYDDPALENSASPTKVIDAQEIFAASSASTQDSNKPENIQTPNIHYGEYKPESGSLISDLLNDMNSSSGSLTPAEQAENRSGTMFYSGNHPEETEIPEPDYSEITIPEDNTAPNAEVLDRILRNIGYEVEGTPQPEKTTPEKSDENGSKSSDTPGNVPDKSEKTDSESSTNEVLKPVHGFYIPQVIDNPLILPENDDEDEPESKDVDSDDLNGSDMHDGSEFDDDQDIPWDLFSSADMALPQSPEDPAFRTFSRSSIPDDPGSTSYQQRMISSILGKIIQAENFVQPVKEKNNREISFGARILWAALAFCGVILLLVSDIADNLNIPLLPAANETLDFYQYADSVTGNALVVMDYAPAYSAEMHTAAENLILSLTGHADRIYLSVLNPAAMPETQQILSQYDGSVEFAGWWPSGVISIRSRLSNGSIPENIWLLTSEITSVRSWAEQISVTGGARQLHVMGPGQLEPLLKPYQQSGMVVSFLSRDMDLNLYGETAHIAGRTQAAVWYLCALIPLAWLGGIVSKTMKTEPNYNKKKAAVSEKTQHFSEIESEKETENND